VNNPITEDDIANYLANTPDFFQRHAELLASVQFTSPHSHRAVSLQERQAEMLREKIKVLEQRVMEMIRNGNENVMLSDKILRWARSCFWHRYAYSCPRDRAGNPHSSLPCPRWACGCGAWRRNTLAQPDFAMGVSDDAKLFASR
jgi:hypothetical protein